MTKAQKAEQAEAIATLRGWLKPGDTVYTILEHVSASGMSRTIRVLIPYTRKEARYTDGWRQIEDGVVALTDTDHGGQLKIRCVADFIHPNHSVALACDYKRDNGRGRDGIKMGGCGMDMGFALVYSLGRCAVS